MKLELLFALTGSCGVVLLGGQDSLLAGPQVFGIISITIAVIDNHYDNNLLSLLVSALLLSFSLH